MKCPKCKAKIGIMNHVVLVHTGAIDCVKCMICGYWAHADAQGGFVGPLPLRTSLRPVPRQMAQV
jgi:hypothetical protein